MNTRIFQRPNFSARFSGSVKLVNKSAVVNKIQKPAALLISWTNSFFGTSDKLSRSVLSAPGFEFFGVSPLIQQCSTGLPRGHTSRRFTPPLKDDELLVKYPNCSGRQSRPDDIERSVGLGSATREGVGYRGWSSRVVFTRRLRVEPRLLI